MKFEGMNEPQLAFREINKPEKPAISHSRITSSHIARDIVAGKMSNVLVSFQETNHCWYCYFQEYFLLVKRFWENWKHFSVLSRNVQNIWATTEAPQASVAVFRKSTKMVFYIEFFRLQIHVRYVFASSSTVIQAVRGNPPVPIGVRGFVNRSRPERKRRFPDLFSVKIREIPII